MKREFMFVPRAILVLQGSRTLVLMKKPNTMVYCNFELIEESSIELQVGMNILLRRVHGDGSEARLEFIAGREAEARSPLLTQEEESLRSNKHQISVPTMRRPKKVRVEDFPMECSELSDQGFGPTLAVDDEHNESQNIEKPFRQRTNSSAESSALGVLDHTQHWARPQPSPLLHMSNDTEKKDIAKSDGGHGHTPRLKPEPKDSSALDDNCVGSITRAQSVFHDGASPQKSTPSTPSSLASPPIKDTPEFFRRMQVKLDQLESDGADEEDSMLQNSPTKLSQGEFSLDAIPEGNLEDFELESPEQSKLPSKNKIVGESSVPEEVEHIPNTHDSSSQSVVIERVVPSRLVIALDDDSTTVDEPKIVLLFLQLGKNMIADRIRILSRVARDKGALVVEEYRGQPAPTHIVIDTHVKAISVAQVLGFRNPTLLAKDLSERKIETVKPEWIGRLGSKWNQPTILQLWNGLASINAKKRKRLPFSERPSARRLLSPEMDSMPISQQEMIPTKPRGPRNQALSDMFLNLSKAFKNCPMDPQDGFKSMMFNMVAGRVLELDFEVVDTPESLARFKAIKGLGNSSLNLAIEFLRTGRCRRLEAFSKDPSKVTISTFMAIWGVGPAKAMSLMNEGYRTLDEVRAAVKTGKVVLEPRALIGLDCYDDFNDEMSREEVEMIGDIVMKAIRETLPCAEITIMGSYRRGKSQLGDIDVLIVDPDWVTETPSEFLGGLVTRLHVRGHMAHHLTNIAGISYDSASSQASLEHRQETKKGHSSGKTFKSQSYMGVFNSPKITGRRRRIDIKFYPYREKAFAQLYFTGSGFFNRSMRVWARRRMGMALNDHGLFRPLDKAFKKTANDRLPIECASEREVFDVLGLVYKEPHERKFFDAVLPKDEAHFDNTETDIKAEASDELQHVYTWIE
jgi:DNA polymerase/3'-5' exonuclease PolX